MRIRCDKGRTYSVGPPGYMQPEHMLQPPGGISDLRRGTWHRPMSTPFPQWRILHRSSTITVRNVIQPQDLSRILEIEKGGKIEVQLTAHSGTSSADAVTMKRAKATEKIVDLIVTVFEERSGEGRGLNSFRPYSN